MRALRNMGIATTALAAVSLGVCLAIDLLEWHLDFVIFAVLASVSGMGTIAVVCTQLSITALQRIKGELVDAYTTEVKQLHRSMVVAMDEYGDKRAIDAVLANERRHAAGDPGEETVELAHAAKHGNNVTWLRQRS